MPFSLHTCLLYLPLTLCFSHISEILQAGNCTCCSDIVRNLTVTTSKVAMQILTLEKGHAMSNQPSAPDFRTIFTLVFTIIIPELRRQTAAVYVMLIISLQKLEINGGKLLERLLLPQQL